MTTKTCSRCKNVKPTASFQNGKRISSHCWECRRETQESWKTRYHDAHQAGQQDKHGVYDPLAFSTLHCKHVAAYVQRAIERFENRTGHEAPPHLTAILNLAKQLTETQQAELEEREQIEKIASIRTCANCGNEFQPRNKHHARYCSRRCREQWRWQLERAARPPKPPRQPKPPKPELPPTACPECGELFTPIGRKTYCRYKCWYTAYYREHRQDYLRRAKESQQRRRSVR